MERFTAFPDVDEVLNDLVGRVSNALPAERYGVYLMGSFATGEGDADSDIDAAIVWDAAGLPDFSDRLMQNAIENARLLNGPRLDPLPASVVFFRGHLLSAKLPGLLRASKLLAGSDLLSGVEMPTLAEHSRGLEDRARHLMRRVHGIARLGASVNLPAVEAPFFGYTRRLMPWHPPGVDEATCEMVELAAGLAAPMAVNLGADFITGKRDAVEKFVSVGAPPWSGFVDALYRRCRIDWRYRIPEGPDERAELSDLCLSLHALEGHFLQEFGGD